MTSSGNGVPSGPPLNRTYEGLKLLQVLRVELRPPVFEPYL